TSRTRTDIYETIATRFTTAAAIRAAMASARRRARPALAVPYAPPATELERVIAAQWEEVLGVTPIGRHDGFSDLGGKSVQLVRIHALLVEALKREFDFTVLFEAATPTALAARLGAEDQPAQGPVKGMAPDRAGKMRHARERMRRRVSQQPRQAP
ncbi:MAG: phosphopantetheine-binding protein, partial [Pseudomonadota bacterium]